MQSTDKRSKRTFVAQLGRRMHTATQLNEMHINTAILSHVYFIKLPVGVEDGPPVAYSGSFT